MMRLVLESASCPFPILWLLPPFCCTAAVSIIVFVSAFTVVICKGRIMIIIPDNDLFSSIQNPQLFICGVLLDIMDIKTHLEKITVVLIVFI